MEDVIVVEEKYSKYWIWIFIGSAALSLVLLFLSYGTANIITANYFQLGAFILFAVVIFALLKLWEGKKSIKVTFNERSLVVDIYKKKDALQRDRYKLDSVENVYRVPSKISVPFLNLFINRTNAATFQLLLHKEDRPFYLFQFSGQVISVNNDAAERISAFLQGKKIPVTKADS